MVKDVGEVGIHGGIRCFNFSQGESAESYTDIMHDICPVKQKSALDLKMGKDEKTQAQSPYEILVLQ